MSMRRIPRTTFLALVAAGALAGCGGSSSPTQPVSGTVKDSPSFSADIQPIFRAYGCSSGGCHGNQAGLTLSSAPVSYQDLVNVSSTEVNELRVDPGSPQASYLVQKLTGTQGWGSSMPPGGRLTNVDLTNIENWIANGAPNN